jgi:DNA helicase HerA-like ATPase
MAFQLGKEVMHFLKGIDMDELHNITMEEEFYRELLDYTLERSYLNLLPERERYFNCNIDKSRITWLRVMRLPVSPGNNDSYDLISRWQGVLSTLHTWEHKIVYLLQRNKGETNLFLGAIPNNGYITSQQALEQMKQATSGAMPGIELSMIDKRSEEYLDKIADPFAQYNYIGTVTGIPSFRKNTNYGLLQTLDPIAFGIRDEYGNERDFAVMVIADPINDINIAKSISKFRELGTDIHSVVKQNMNESQSQFSSMGISVGLGAIISGLLNIAAKCTGGPIPSKAFSSISNSAMGGGISFSRTTGKAISRSISREYIDKFAEYAEELTERHVERLKKGRNLGFWNVGIYTLGNNNSDITTVMGMLRSIYSGDETYIEPIRASILNSQSGALDIARRFQLVPLANIEDEADYEEGWHPFGKQYEYISTPLNTEELSLATSLPRRDVPGLRFVKTAVRFAANPSEEVGQDAITFGKVIDTGVLQNSYYKMNPHALVRHGIISGATGSGKSTTCKKIIREITNRKIPVMIIEPAKDDYVRWAIEQNKILPEDQRYEIYMPGVKEFEGVNLSELRINPFEPAAVKNANIDIMTHYEQLVNILNTALPTSDVLPVIIDEAIYRYLKNSLGEAFMNGESKQADEYPKLDGVIEVARRLLAERGYDRKVQDDLGAALETRFSFLIRGKRGRILNVRKSVDFTKLFNKNVIINLSKISGTKDKSLIMALLFLDLYEYRVSAYSNDKNYRKLANDNHLLQLTVIEEAHNLLEKPTVDISRSGNAQQIAADMFSNIMSEIRGYGQGLLLVDQIPTRLVQDAIKNTNYKIVHRMTSPDDCEIMASSLALREDQKNIIPSLGRGEIIISGDLDDAASWVKIEK